MADTIIDIQHLKRAHGERTRQGRCRGCRADFPCQSLFAAQEIDRLTEENDNLAAEVDLQHGLLERASSDRQKDVERLTARLAAVERERDEWGGQAATLLAERNAFRRQRDEAQQALQQLMGTTS